MTTLAFGEVGSLELGTHFEVQSRSPVRTSLIADGQCPKHGRRQRGKMKEQMSSELSTDSIVMSTCTRLTLLKLLQAKS